MLLAVLCFVPRLLCLSFHFYPTNSKSFYWELSDSLLQSGTLGFHGIKTTAFEPLYPLFLAGARLITRDHMFFVLLFQIIIEIIGCLYLYKLAQLLARNKYVGFITSLLYSLYPYFIYQTGAISEITLFTTLLIMSTYYYCKANGLKHSIYCGAFFGLTAMTRTTALPILFLGIGALALKKFYKQAFIMLGTALFILSPMMIRNYQIDGSLILTRSGENLFDGNLELSDKLIPDYSVDLLYAYVNGILEKERPDLVKNNSKKRNQFFTQKAVQFMIEHPWRVLKLKLKNIGYLFYPRIVPFYPMREETRLIVSETGDYHIEKAYRRNPIKELIHSIPYTFILLTAIIGIYLRRKEFQTDLILYLITFSFVATYALYFPTTRLRAPMDFVLMFYSACTIEMFLKHKVPAWTQLTKNPA